MPADAKPLPAFDPDMVSQLACPVCLGGLSLVDEVGQDAARLACAECGRGFPIVDGIPVLIAGREKNAQN